MLTFSQFLSEDVPAANHLQPTTMGDQTKQRMAAHQKTFTPAIHKTLAKYKMNSHDSFNGVLRGTLNAKEHKKKYGYYHTPTELKHMDHVTSHPLHEPMTVYRGFRKDDNHDISKHPPGHEFTDHGYASTSLNPHTAHSFGHVTKIHLPAGTKGHHLPDENKTYNGEDEYLLKRGTKFRVLKHDHYSHPGSDRKFPMTHLEVVHQSD